jgi:hypothetical protein
MTGQAMRATRAAIQGLGLAARAPGLLLSLLAVTVIATIPFAVVVDSAVMKSLAAEPPPSAIGGSEVDPEWWLEFRRHAGGLAATFTPAVLGFAAPLDSISALLDGRRPPAALVAPIAVSALIWAFLWGGIVNRFARGETSARAFFSAGRRYYGRMLAITLIAAVAAVLLYTSLHGLLFGVVYDAVAGSMPSERDAFGARVVLYVAFGAVLALLNAVFAFARIHVVRADEESVTAATSRAWAFVRAQLASVTALSVMFIAILAAVMIGYGALELTGGARVGGWRAVAIGQAFVLVRLGLRLAFSASQVRLASQTVPQ